MINKMINLNKKCKYYNDNGECKLLLSNPHSKEKRVAIKCDGWDNKCKFAKTEQQFIDDNDRAIFVCRQRGLCNNCKYVDVACKMSMEG